jgi:hypothetical protein
MLVKSISGFAGMSLAFRVFVRSQAAHPLAPHIFPQHRRVESNFGSQNLIVFDRRRVLGE